MKPFFMIAASLVCVLSIFTSSAQQPLSINVSFEEVLAVPIRPADARIEYGPQELQYGELWLPAQSAEEPAPLVILVHGGCWLNSFDVSHTYGFSTALAERGFAVWALEYRRTGDAGGGWPGTYQDIQAAIQAVSLLEDYAVDTGRVALLGHSAGGHLALLAGSDPAVSRQIDLLVGLAAIVDIEQYSQGGNSCQSATSLFMNGTVQDIPQAYSEANPAEQQLYTRTVLFHGDADQIVPSAQAELNGAETRVFQGAGHFDWIHPDTGAFADLLILLEELL